MDAAADRALETASNKEVYLLMTLAAGQEKMRAQLAATDVDEMWEKSEIEDKLAVLEDQDCKNKVSKMKAQWKAWRLWVKKASQGKF
eukprot:1485049-Rhodomonas_salina.1